LERLDLDLVGPAPDFGQFVVELADQPFAGRRAERLFQPDGHLGRNARPGVQQIAEGLAIDAEESGGIGHAQPVPFKAILPDRRSWVHRLPIRVRPDGKAL
jgi:hypothetical protein